MSIFSINETEYGWEEILAAARVWGEWDEALLQVRQGAAAQRRGNPSPADVQAAATQFRYKHKLISGQEAQQWLASWNLTVEEWMGYIRRELSRQQGAASDEETSIPDAEIAAATHVDVICSGRFARWARKLAGRAALAEKSGKRIDPQSSPRARIEQLEAIYLRECEQAVTLARVQNTIADHRMEWIRFDCRYVWFPEERIAREAAMCVTTDGLSLDEVAYDSRSLVQHWNFYLDEIESPIRPHFLAARAGDWLGPIPMLEGFPLFAIERKSLPTSGDPRVYERAEASILKNLLDLEMNNRIQWMAQL